MRNIIEVDLDISKYILDVSTNEQLNKKLNEARRLLFGSIDEYYNYCNNGPGNCIGYAFISYITLAFKMRFFVKFILEFH